MLGFPKDEKTGAETRSNRRVLLQALLSTTWIINITCTWLLSLEARRELLFHTMKRSPQRYASLPKTKKPVIPSRTEPIHESHDRFHYPPLLRMKRRPLKALNRHIATLPRR